jgi:hypothetical protein
VIDRPALIAWRSQAPWPNPVQIEQDLLLSRLMIEIARDASAGFRRDLDALTTHIPAGYDPDIAGNLVIRELGSHLRNAPPVQEIDPLGRG